MADKWVDELRIAQLEGKLWAILFKAAERRDLDGLREILSMIEVVEKI